MKSETTRPRAATVAPILLIWCMLSISLPHSVAAQRNPVLTDVVPPSEAVSFYAEIQAVDMNTRQVMLDGRGGRRVTVVAAPDIDLNKLNPGQTVSAVYYRSVAFFVSPTMDVPKDQIDQITAHPAQLPGGFAVSKTKVSGLVVGIDLAAHSIDVVNPAGGGVYTIDVTDPARIAMLPQLKVGDTITAVISQAVLVSIEPAPKS